MKSHAKDFDRFMGRFQRDDKGVVAIIFALSVMIIMSAVGGAVDYGRWLSARSQTLAAMDAAVLAAGRVLQHDQSNEAGAIAAAQQYYAKNKSSLLSVDDIDFSVSNGEVVLSMSASTVSTPFLSVLGIKSLPVNNVSRAQLAVGGNSGTHIELSLILDITGSMQGQPIVDLREAAKDLVDIIIWQDQSEYTSKIALVPYAAAVNVGPFADQIRGALSGGTCTSPGCASYQFRNPWGNWVTQAGTTCASVRTGNQAYTDTSPSTAAFPPIYLPSNNGCPSAELIPLTNNKTVLKDQIDLLAPAGSTAGHTGTAWGWYTLSPNFSTVWPTASQPRSYSELSMVNEKGNPVLKKIAVFMTDGANNTAYCDGVISYPSSSSGSGSNTQKKNCASPNGTSFAQNHELCTAMKAADITIYTVGFNISDNQAVQTLLQNCATDSTHAYDASDGNQLRAAFRDIALKIATLRLVQ